MSSVIPDQKTMARRQTPISDTPWYAESSVGRMAAGFENKINQLEKKKLDLDSLRKNHKKQWIIKNSELILKSQQRFRSEKRNVFT